MSVNHDVMMTRPFCLPRPKYPAARYRLPRCGRFTCRQSVYHLV